LDSLGEFGDVGDHGIGSSGGQVVGLAGLVGVADACGPDRSGGLYIGGLVTDQGAGVWLYAKGLGGSLDQVRAGLHQAGVRWIASLDVVDEFGQADAVEVGADRCARVDVLVRDLVDGAEVVDALDGATLLPEFLWRQAS